MVGIFYYYIILTTQCPLCEDLTIDIS